MNFAVVNLGCKVNRVESDDAAARLALRGVETSEASADFRGGFRYRRGIRRMISVLCKRELSR